MYSQQGIGKKKREREREKARDRITDEDIKNILKVTKLQDFFFIFHRRREYGYDMRMNDKLISWPMESSGYMLHLQGLSNNHNLNQTNATSYSDPHFFKTHSNICFPSMPRLS